jgi:probable HAF family extracellular repeat protein
MTRRPPTLIAAAVLSAPAFAASAQASALDPYTLIDPGTFGGPNSFYEGPGVPISSNGTLVGVADTATPDSYGRNCGDFGYCDGYDQYGFTFNHGQLTELGALPGGNSGGIFELNSGGFGAGYSDDGLLDPNTGIAAAVAVLFEHGKVINLGTLPGAAESFAQEINDQWQVTGFSSNGVPDQYSYFAWGTETRGLVWRDGVMRDLGTLGGDNGYADWISDSGAVIGNAQTADGSWHGFLWQHGKIVELPPVDGTPQSGANSINDQGQVVGNTNDASGDQLAAVLWNHGIGHDLNTLIAPSSLQLYSAQYINDQGDILAQAQLPDGDQHIVELVRNPWVPLPPTSTAGPAVTAGVADHSPTAAFALTAGRHGIRAGIHQLMLASQTTTAMTDDMSRRPLVGACSGAVAPI